MSDDDAPMNLEDLEEQRRKVQAEGWTFTSVLTKHARDASYSTYDAAVAALGGTPSTGPKRTGTADKQYMSGPLERATFVHDLAMQSYDTGQQADIEAASDLLQHSDISNPAYAASAMALMAKGTLPKDMFSRLKAHFFPGQHEVKDLASNEPDEENLPMQVDVQAVDLVPYSQAVSRTSVRYGHKAMSWKRGKNDQILDDLVDVLFPVSHYADRQWFAYASALNECSWSIVGASTTNTQAQPRSDPNLAGVHFSAAQYAILQDCCERADVALNFPTSHYIQYLNTEYLFHNTGNNPVNLMWYVITPKENTSIDPVDYIEAMIADTAFNAASAPGKLAATTANNPDLYLKHIDNFFSHYKVLKSGKYKFPVDGTATLSIKSYPGKVDNREIRNYAESTAMTTPNFYPDKTKFLMLRLVGDPGTNQAIAAATVEAGLCNTYLTVQVKTDMTCRQKPAGTGRHTGDMILGGNQLNLADPFTWTNVSEGRVEARPVP